MISQLVKVLKQMLKLLKSTLLFKWEGIRFVGGTYSFDSWRILFFRWELIFNLGTCIMMIYVSTADIHHVCNFSRKFLF